MTTISCTTSVDFKCEVDIFLKDIARVLPSISTTGGQELQRKFFTIAPKLSAEEMVLTSLGLFAIAHFSASLNACATKKTCSANITPSLLQHTFKQLSSLFKTVESLSFTKDDLEALDPALDELSRATSSYHLSCMVANLLKKKLSTGHTTTASRQCSSSNDELWQAFQNTLCKYLRIPLL